MSHIYKTILVDAPIEKVFEIARDPERWNMFFNNLSAPDDIKGNGDPGTIVKHHFTLAGMTFPVTSRVIEAKLAGPKAIWKGSFEGPIVGTHDWTYVAKGPKQTEVTVDLNYTIPGKLLGKITDKLLIERIQEKAAATTLENLKLLCEAEVAAPVFA